MCYNPLYGYFIPGQMNENGKQKYYVRRFRHEPFEKNPEMQCISLPCGKCLDCQLNYARQWAIRCVLESKEHEYNYFITLTYNEENVPTTEVINNLGQMATIKTLKKSDLQSFNKVLRQHYKRHFNHDKIRFYGVGEYGSGGRPHYHVIYFNLPIDDLKFYKKSKDGKPLWISPTLSKLWKKGYVVIGEVNAQTAGYVARYCNKKLGSNLWKLNGDLYENVEREFTLCSRRPGIAFNYYQNHKDIIYLTDEIFDNGQKYKPPRYYDRLLDKEDEVLLADVKNTRLMHAVLDEIALNIPNKSIYLSKCAEVAKNTTKSLKRINIPLDKSLDSVYNRVIQNRYFLSDERKEEENEI